MKTRILSAALLAGAVMLTGCGSKDDAQGKTAADITAKSSAKDIGEAYVNELTRIADALETVDNKQSAEKAAKTIQKAAAGLDSLQEDLDGKADSMKTLEILAARSGELTVLQTRIMEQMMRIQREHPELMETLDQEMANVK